MYVINRNKGRLSYNMVSFWIASEPVILQRRRESLLKYLPGLQVYVGDMLVAFKKGQTWLQAVLQLLRDNCVELNKGMYAFREPQLKFLGYQIDAHGLHLKSNNLDEILKASRPTNVWELRS